MANKIEREIEEILSRTEGFPPKRPFRSRLRRALRGFFSSLSGLLAALPRPRLSLGHLMLLALGLIIVGWAFDLGRPIIIAGLALLGLAFILSLRRSSRVPEKHWRGQPMELQPSMGDRFRSWWERWRSRR